MRCLRTVIRGCYRAQNGFSLLEVLISVSIIAFIGVAVITSLDTNARAARILDEQVTANNLATSYFEAIRHRPYDNTSGGEYSGATDNITLPNQYQVDVVIDYSEDGTDWVNSANRTTETLQRITLVVSRTDGKQVLLTCTYRTDR